MNTRYTQTIVSLALAEDLGSGDVTTNALVSKNHARKARIIAKSSGIVCGLGLVKETFCQLDKAFRFQPLLKDGDKVKAGQTIARLSGAARALLSGERTALNFLGQLSGIATKTRAFVEAVRPYKTAILDTRKTTPLLRQLERYAVRCGGGSNHRFNLSDMAMLKDNHLACAQQPLPGRAKIRIDFAALVEAIRSKKNVKIELEVDSLSQLKDVLSAGADVILLDNMTPSQVRQAVRLRKRAKSKVPLEASGGITLKNVRQYAAAGVERVSIGVLTHSRQALDVSLEFDQ